MAERNQIVHSPEQISRLTGKCHSVFHRSSVGCDDSLEFEGLASDKHLCECLVNHSSPLTMTPMKKMRQMHKP